MAGSVPSIYRHHGWQGLLPIPGGRKSPPPGKDEYPPHGFTGALGRMPTKKDWLNWPVDGNFGLRLPDFVVGIDVDTYGEKKGADQLKDLERRYGHLPPTFISSSREDPLLSGIRFFRINPGFQLPGKLANDIEAIQFHHRYAVVWPSRFEDRPYRWWRQESDLLFKASVPDISEIADLPDGWYKVSVDEITPAASFTNLPIKLIDLLGLPADSPLRGNDWLTRVAGHLARRHRDDYDKYLRKLKRADQKSTHPHSPAMFNKTAKSVWKLESAKGLCDKTTGHLMPTSMTTLAVKIRNSEGKEHVEQFADFNIEAKSVIDDGEGNTSYEVVIHRARDGASIDTIVNATIFADPRRLEAWLAGFRVALVSPINGMPPGVRLRLYLESQDPPHSKVTDHLGWHSDVGFIVNDGIITENGLQPFSNLRPNPRRKSQMEIYEYGFEGTESAALRVLRQAATFHYPELAGPLFAWLIMLALKGQQRWDLFPPFVVEARAGVGKSKGIIPVARQLFGHRDEHGNNATVPATRNLMSAHANAAIWRDDATNLGGLEDLIRELTGGGTRSKMGQDNSRVEMITLRSGLILTGEGFGTTLSEPAMLERCVIIRDLKDPQTRTAPDGRPQIEEIKDLQTRYNGNLAQIAGHVLSATMRRRPMLDMMPGLKTGTGRMGEVNAILRTGARIFADLVGTDRHIKAVDRLVTARGDGEYLTFTESEILPYVLRATNQPHSNNGCLSAAYINDETGEIHVNPGAVSDVWNRRIRASGREQILSSPVAIGSDLARAGASESKTERPSGESGKYRKYRRIPAKRSKLIIAVL